MLAGRYHCSQDDHGYSLDITIMAKETEKSYVLTLIEDKSRFPAGHIEMLFKRSRKVIIPKKNCRPGGHPILDSGTWFVIYPFQAGIPFSFDLQDEQADRACGENNCVVEWCSECESEIEMRWDVTVRGYRAFCPVCGKVLMLCDECRHREQTGEPAPPCELDSVTGVCQYNSQEVE